MKPITHTFLIAAIAMVTTGCIRKEPLNAECDIIAATLPGDVMSQNAAIRNSEVTLFVKKGTDKSALAPEFILTEGATIDPPQYATLTYPSDTPLQPKIKSGRKRIPYGSTSPA